MTIMSSLALKATTITETPIWKVYHLPIGSDDLARKVVITSSGQTHKRYEVWYGNELCWTERVVKSDSDNLILQSISVILDLAYARNYAKRRKDRVLAA